MEKRFYLGLSILAVILAASIGVTLGMRAIHEPVQQMLIQAADTAEADWGQSLSLAQKAYDRWQHYYSMTASFADHSPMDDTDTLFQEMLVYGQMEEIPHFIACCRELTVMTEAMYDAHAFSLKNLL
jgi:hypothetical protein